MRVLLLGGAGFLGQALATRLVAKGIEPVVCDTEARLFKAGPIVGSPSLVEYPNVENLSRVAVTCQALVHLASTTGPASSMERPIEDVLANVAASISVFEIARRAGVRRIVFTSSGGTVYGRVGPDAVTEKEPQHPISVYGASKVAVEQYLGVYNDAFGLSGVTLRISNPYGAYQLRGTSVGVIARYLSQISSRESITVFGDGSVTRDYINVDDVVEGIILSLDERLVPAGVYNLGSGIGYSINQIISLISDITGFHPHIILKKPRGFDVPSIVLDNSLFRKVTGWSPVIGLEQGVRKLWEELCQDPLIRTDVPSLAARMK